MPQITVTALDGAPFEALFEPPQGSHGEGLILLGAAAAHREEAARRGYVALCPLLGDKQAQETVGDLLSSLAFLRGRAECGGKVGAWGIGAGACAAFLMAARSDVDAAALCGAEGIAPFWGEALDVRAPCLFLLDESDALAVRARRAGARGAPFVCVEEKTAPLDAVWTFFEEKLRQ